VPNALPHYSPPTHVGPHESVRDTKHVIHLSGRSARLWRGDSRPPNRRRWAGVDETLALAVWRIVVGVRADPIHSRRRALHALGLRVNP